MFCLSALFNVELNWSQWKQATIFHVPSPSLYVILIYGDSITVRCDHEGTRVWDLGRSLRTLETKLHRNIFRVIPFPIFFSIVNLVWQWRRMGKINWTDRVKHEDVLHRDRQERNILHTVKRWKANRIGRILRRNCLLKPLLKER